MDTILIHCLRARGPGTDMRSGGQGLACPKSGLHTMKPISTAPSNQAARFLPPHSTCSGESTDTFFAPIR